MPGSHLVPPFKRPTVLGTRPQGRCPPAALVPQSLGRGLWWGCRWTRSADVWGVCRKGGGWGIPQPVPARLASARWAQGSSIQGEGRRGDTATVKCVTRRQMSPPPSAAACEVAGGALRGGEGTGGTVSPWEKAQPLWSRTPILTTGSRGDREGMAIDGAEQGSTGCSREAATCFGTGVGEGSCVEGPSPPGVLCVHPH